MYIRHVTSCIFFTDRLIRLVSIQTTTSGSSGVLEVYYRGTWGQPCPYNFGTNEAKVACRELGLPTWVFLMSFYFNTGVKKCLALYITLKIYVFLILKFNNLSKSLYFGITKLNPF